MGPLFFFFLDWIWCLQPIFRDFAKTRKSHFQMLMVCCGLKHVFQNLTLRLVKVSSNTIRENRFHETSRSCFISLRFVFGFALPLLALPCARNRLNFSRPFLRAASCFAVAIYSTQKSAAAAISFRSGRCRVENNRGIWHFSVCVELRLGWGHCLHIYPGGWAFGGGVWQRLWACKSTQGFSTHVIASNAHP